MNMQLELDPSIQTPIARVAGQDFVSLPEDLYIPPDALRVFLEAFEGPLDLLLYLIKKQNLDIREIPIAEITAQYLKYIHLMNTLDIELAAEYLTMAALLAEIKSSLLLPKPPAAEQTDELEDPRAALIQQLLTYEQFKKASHRLDQLPRVERDCFIASVYSDIVVPLVKPKTNVLELRDALVSLLKRNALYRKHEVQKESLSVREKMTNLLLVLQPDQLTSFQALLDLKEGRMGVVVMVLAILELTKQSLIECIQPAPFAPIYLKTVSQCHVELPQLDSGEVENA